MPDSFTLYLGTTPGDTRRALPYGLTLAHMAYRVGSELNLLRDHIGTDMNGGLMVLSYTPTELRDGSTMALCKEVLNECRIRNYMGLLLDFEGPVRHLLSRVVSSFDTMCHKEGLQLMVNERYLEATQYAAVVVSSALVSGSLRQKLEYYAGHYGSRRVVLEIERLSQDIALPAPQGRGITMNRTELNQLLLERRPTTFFSHELCAHYFTYKDSLGVTHFVLFDDASSITKKLSLARMLDLSGTILLYSETVDLLPELRGYGEFK